MLKKWIKRWKEQAGSSLIEVLVSIVILGLVVVPLGSSFVLSVRLNTRSRDLMKEQLAVSNAVEYLMATGIDEGEEGENLDSDGFYLLSPEGDPFQNVTIQVGSQENGVYPVTVTYKAELQEGEEADFEPFSITTTVRPASALETPSSDDEAEEGGDDTP